MRTSARPWRPRSCVSATASRFPRPVCAGSGQTPVAAAGQCPAAEPTESACRHGPTAQRDQGHRVLQCLSGRSSTPGFAVPDNYSRAGIACRACVARLPPPLRKAIPPFPHPVPALRNRRFNRFEVERAPYTNRPGFRIPHPSCSSPWFPNACLPISNVRPAFRANRMATHRRRHRRRPQDAGRPAHPARWRACTVSGAAHRWRCGSRSMAPARPARLREVPCALLPRSRCPRTCAGEFPMSMCAGFPRGPRPCRPSAGAVSKRGPIRA